MKKITLLLFLMTFSFGYSQTAAPVQPARNAWDVISVFCSDYTDLADTNFNPNWGQSTQYAQVALGGNMALHYTNLNYQGIQFAGSPDPIPVDASSMTTLHMDIYSADITSLNVYLIASGENAVAVPLTANAWTAVDITLSTGYAARNLANIIQFKFDETAPTSTHSFYVDNIYFYRPATATPVPTYGVFTIPSKSTLDAPFTITPPTSTSTGAFTYTSSNTAVAEISGDIITIKGLGTSTITANQAAAGSYSAGSKTGTFTVVVPPPAVGATTPIARNTTDYISFYNGITSPVAPEYTNLAGVVFDSFGGTTIDGDVTLGDGNVVKKYSKHLYSGIGGGDVNVAGMTKLHIDVYSPGFTAFRIKLEAVNGTNVELDVPGAKTQGSWNSYDIDLSTYSAVDLAHLKWIVPVTYTPPGETLYIDNVYFYRPATNAAADATLTDLKYGTTSITGFAPGTLSYSVLLPKGTTAIPQITGTKANSLATATTTQATALPGSATVMVTSADASATKTYTVNFTVDTNSACAGTSNVVTQGDPLATGYKYGFVTSGTDVTITFELLDTKDGLVAYLWKESPFSETAMTNVSGQIFSKTITGQTPGGTISYGVKFAFAGGLNVTKYFSYVVGDACSLGVVDFKALNINMYPNPVSDVLNISAAEAIQKVTVYNLLGQEVLSQSVNANSVSVGTSSIQSGVYVLTAEIGGKTASSKFVKK